MWGGGGQPYITESGPMIYEVEEMLMILSIIQVEGSGINPSKVVGAKDVIILRIQGGRESIPGRSIWVL